MYVCMHACMYVCMYVYMYACMHVYMYTNGRAGAGSERQRLDGQLGGRRDDARAAAVRSARKDGTHGVLTGTYGFSPRTHSGTCSAAAFRRYSRSTLRVLYGYSRSTLRVLLGCGCPRLCRPDLPDSQGTLRVLFGYSSVAVRPSATLSTRSSLGRTRR